MAILQCIVFVIIYKKNSLENLEHKQNFKLIKIIIIDRSIAYGVAQKHKIVKKKN
jgi:hypothetical protein